MALDLYTLHFASAASRCAYVVVFLVMALSQRRQACLWQWMGAMGASMAGSLIMMRVPTDELPPIPVTVAVYWLYGASLVLAWTGLRSFFGRPAKVGLGLVLAALPGVLYPVALGLGLSTRLALAGVFACCLLPTLLAASETVRLSAGTERLWAQSIETVAFGLYALVFVLSIGMLVGTDLPVASAESARISMVVDQVMGVFVYFGFVAMAAERANRTLLRLAETDPLTGLSNRRGLQTMLRRRFPHPGARPAMGVLILDVDHFKAINDRHGHEGGDRVLSEFGARMKAALRATDMVARWGGEEFLVVLPGTDARELLSVAERLRATIAEAPFLLPSGPLRVTVSIGAAGQGPGEAGFEEALHRADAALYDAKSRGRDRVVCAPAPVDRVSADDVACAGLRAA
ncbi:diguanylate cyclase [Methylobacterium sp. J-078]|uniref:GGDEF domain-containing protein n=1 Tax=Methylobacterium sp. J-078 TaxID=2836657 RepID=UPI001FB965B5|nr:GGDEF domain-containing protein [Methylobacterium sp. J-078]MCJ2045364.1 diguanylate cyclase [Methylobacterium sp. J-078]